MKTLLSVVAGLCVFGVIATQAEEKKERSKPTAEQKAVLKEIKDKYDTNKDGQLDKEEKAKISAEDKEKLQKAGLGHQKKKKE